MIYILYGSVLVFAIFLVSFVIRNLRSAEAEQSEATSAIDDQPQPAHPNPEATTALAATEAQPPQAPVNDAFDPTATQIYSRPPQQVPGDGLKREGIPLDRAVLLGLSGSLKNKSFPVTEAGVTIGRSAPNDIVLTDPRVSSHHAWIGIVAGKAVLRDLHSTNGTFLNANMRAAIDEVELRPNDTIFFGGHQGDQFRFVVDHLPE